MKKLLFVFLISTTSLLIGQDSSYSSSPFFPKAGSIGTTLNVTGLIDNIQLQTTDSDLGQNLLFVRYYLKDDLALRLGLGVNLNTFNQKIADSLGNTLVEADSSYSKFVFNISGGIEKHLKGTKRLDPYVFGQLNLTFVGKENIEVDAKVTAPNGVGTGNQTIKTDGGIGIGLLAGAGFNYFLAKNFSIGSEVGLAFNYSSIGGTRSDNTVITPISGPTTNDFKTSEDQIKQTEIGVQGNALINISYFF